MSTKIEELNKIYVFLIADGDTWANIKVCLKLPTQNLLLDPSGCVLMVTSNLAADDLLDGQEDSGTILSHFFVSFVEAVKMIGKHQLTIDKLAACIVATGAMMNDAVTNPVKGTLISVSQVACCGLKEMGTFDTLNDLIQAWEARAQAELAKTPDQLVVDGV
jgi:dihydroxyacetone kinase-like predicted kinase